MKSNLESGIRMKAEELRKEYHRRLRDLETQKSKRLSRVATRVPSMEPMSYGVECLIEKASGDHNRKTSVVRERSLRRSGMDFLKPSNQLPRNSFLGRKLHGHQNHWWNPEWEGEDDVDNRTDSFGSEGSEDPPSDDARNAIWDRGRPRRPRYKEIAPTKPDKYNGEPNILKFHRFISQCERYLDEGNVPPYDRVAKCSNFLEEKAYKYYSTEVSFNEDRWSTEKFFKGIFNYCFPPDFRLKQCERLERFNQRDRRVREYAAELKIIY